MHRKLIDPMTQTEKKEFNKSLFTLALPLALQSLLSALVGASDAFLLGRLTQEAIAAVSLANQINFVMSLFLGASTGGVGVLAAQYWGKKDYQNVKRYTGTAIRYAALISGVFFLAAFLFPAKLMRIFTPEPVLIEIGAQYLRVVSFSYLFLGIAGCYQMIMKIAGFANLAVQITAVTVAVDMTADFFLIYGIGSWKGLGAVGSAYSTIAVEMISLIWCMRWAAEHKEVHVHFEDIKYFSGEHEKAVWKVIPGLLAGSLAWGLSISMHSVIIGHLGVDAAAAYSVTTVTQQLIECLTQGFANGAAIMIGALLGNNELEKAKKYGDRFWLVALAGGFINVLLIAVVGPFMYVFYVLEPAAKHYLVQMLIMSCFYMFAYSFNTVFTCGVFPAGGDTLYDAVSVGIATWCFAIPLSLLACFVFHMPVMAVYVIMCLDEVVKFPFLWPRHHKYIWLRNLT